MVFRGLRKLGIVTSGCPTTHHVHGFLAVITTMYIPMRNCMRVITEKKATTRFFPRVRACKLLNK